MKTKFFFFFLLLITLLPTSIVFAVDLPGNSPFPKDTQTGSYKMLAPLGNFLGNGGVIDINSGLSTYLNGLFRMGIILATGLAIIMITVGGLKYASTDAINGKSEGKEMIQQALLGLMLALMSVLLLQQINPSVLKSDLDVESVNTTGSTINTDPVTLNTSGGTVSNDGSFTTVPTQTNPTPTTTTTPTPTQTTTTPSPTQTTTPSPTQTTTGGGQTDDSPSGPNPLLPALDWENRRYQF